MPHAPSSGLGVCDRCYQSPARRSSLQKTSELESMPTCASAEKSGLYVIGDAAGTGDGSELPMLSAPALQQGRFVARSILRDIAGRPPEPPFRYVDKGTMATIGRNAAVAHFRGGLELTGFLGWLAWTFVHIWYLIGFRNRLAALSWLGLELHPFRSTHSNHSASYARSTGLSSRCC